MASIKGALKKVYKSLSGGTESSAKSISGIIDDISTVASGGGGGAGAFIVKFIFDMQTGKITGADKTLEEIYQACKDGKNVVGLSNYIMEDTESEFSEFFSYFNLTYSGYSYETDGSVTVETYEAFFEQNMFTNHNPITETCDLSVQVISYTSNNGVSTIELYNATNKSASSNN